MSEYTVGKQPCENYKPHKDEHGLDNVHCCWFCTQEDRTVSSCENCLTDHHEGGYETCEHDGCSCGKMGD